MSPTHASPTLWQRLKLAAWLCLAAHAWLPWLVFKHRRREQRRKQDGAPPSRPRFRSLEHTARKHYHHATPPPPPKGNRRMTTTRRDLYFLQKAADDLEAAARAPQPDPQDPLSRLGPDDTGRIIAFAVFFHAPPKDPAKAFEALAAATRSALRLAKPRPARRERILHLVYSAKTPAERLAASIWLLMKVASSPTAISDNERVREVGDIAANAWIDCASKTERRRWARS